MVRSASAITEDGDARFGPYHPVGGPVPLHHYRQHKKGKREKRADRVAALAGALQVPRAVLEGHPALASIASVAATAALPRKAFADPDPYREFAYINRHRQARYRGGARNAACPAVGRGAGLHRLCAGRNP